MKQRWVNAADRVRDIGVAEEIMDTARRVEEGAGMIMRRWRGAVRPEDAEAYLTHQAGTGILEYRRSHGNRGVFVLRRPDGARVEVITLSLWESMDDVRGFAGDHPEVAVFYPGDDDLLVEKDEHVDHYEVVSVELDEDLGRGER